MTHKKALLPAALCCVGMLAVASVANADVIMNAGGWQASAASGVIASIVVDNPTDPIGDGYLIIQISKDFDPDFAQDMEGNFPAILIDFVQIAENASRESSSRMKRSPTRRVRCGRISTGSCLTAATPGSTSPSRPVSTPPRSPIKRGRA